ncbi:MAG: cob(I)yrinic acid a,c-diamide adenosyltransferase [Phycisphaerae bacterium]|jgi:cob(I)alamin adenosyltransferase
MPRLTRIYTRTGDDGTTALGTGERVAKTSARVAAYGAIDELNSQLGVALASGLLAELVEPLRTAQNELFHAGADLCVPEKDKPSHPGPRIEARHVERLERLMDRLSESLPALENFVLPGGAAAAAQLHVARAVCRRAERDVARLMELEPVNPQILRYLNRLSDTLFVMARRQNHAAGVPEPTWDSRA